MAPYKEPAMPGGDFLYLEQLPVKSHRSRYGNKGGSYFSTAFPVYSYGNWALPAHTMPVAVEQETVYDVEKTPYTAFAAKVYVHPEHGPKGKCPIDYLQTCFEVIVDGKVRAQSGFMRAGEAPRLLVVDNLSGTKELKLLARFDAPEERNIPMSYYPLCFYGVWEEPRLFAPREALAQAVTMGPFQTDWNMIGLFPAQNKTNPPETELKLDAKYPGRNPQKPGEAAEVSWHRITVRNPPGLGQITLFGVGKDQGLDVLRPVEGAIYALVYAQCAEDLDAVLETRYIRGLKMWVNGAVVLDESQKGFELTPVKLKKGANPILIKSVSEGWAWFMSFRAGLPSAQADKLKFTLTER
jgi:hypothetical protein